MARAFETGREGGRRAAELVVYNAGNMAAGPIAEMTDDFFEATWRVCAFGGVPVRARGRQAHGAARRAAR